MEFFCVSRFLITFPSAIFLSIYLIFFLRSQSRPKQNGFKIYPFFGTFPQAIGNIHRILDWSTEILSTSPSNTSTAALPCSQIRGLITANPANVEHMLKTNFQNYPKGPRSISNLHDFLGQGIFNSNGETWKIQRKIASYEFNTKSFRNLVMQTVITELQSRFIPILKQAAGSHRVIDLQDLLERFAFDNVCKVAFNVDPDCLSDESATSPSIEFMKAFQEAATLSCERFMYAFPFLYKIKRFFNMGSEKALRSSIKAVHQFADNVIRQRLVQEKTNDEGEDLLSRFVKNSETNSVKFLRDIIISFILAGRDTTSSALTWFFWLLHSNPRVAKKITEELNLIRKRKNGENKNEKSFDFEDLREMNYLQAAISEGMRLYPPLPFDIKGCVEDDRMPDGSFVGKGWFVAYHAYAMGRMEGIWGKDCYEFKPERWLDEGGVCKQESQFKFPVFHGGLRVCLGKDMAYIQMKLIAATVVEMFEIEVVGGGDGKSPEHLLSLTLRMKGGLQVKVKERT